jgi:hypothetical protein
MTLMIRPARARCVRRRSKATLAVGATLVMVTTVGLAGTRAASAAQAQGLVDLGTATSYAVLAGETVTNTGPSIITGDLGLSPGTDVPGFPPGVIIGAEHVANPEAVQAKDDLIAAYDDAAGRTPATPVADLQLGGRTLTPGVYSSASTLGLTGTLTLDAQGASDAVFIFQAGSSLITATDSTVRLINGAQACNVFWQVTSSATLNTNSVFVGTILALTSVFARTGATVNGRLLARNGEVTLQSNTVTRSDCAAASPPAPPPAGPDVPPDVIPPGHPETGAGGASTSGQRVATVIGATVRSERVGPSFGPGVSEICSPTTDRAAA